MMPPWCEASDFAPGERPAWDIEIDDWAHHSCWGVYPNGPHNPRQYLMVHAERGNGNDGGLITLSHSDVPRYDLYYGKRRSQA